MKAKLIIATDLGRLRAYRIELTPKGTPHLDPVADLMLLDAHRRFADRVTDMAGRHSGPTQKRWGTPMADDHNLRLETERRLIKEIAKHVEQIVLENGHEGVWFAAHKEINHQILDELPRPIGARIEKNLSRDLTKAEPTELLDQFLNAGSD